MLALVKNENDNCREQALPEDNNTEFWNPISVIIICKRVTVLLTMHEEAAGIRAGFYSDKRSVMAVWKKYSTDNAQLN